MKNTAAELSKLAISSLPKNKNNTCNKCGNIGLSENDNGGNLVCVNCGHTWKKKHELTPSEKFAINLSKGSKKYCDYVLDKCEYLAMRGFGSVKITIDKTTDLFMIDEGSNSFYSHDIVVTYLNNHGFNLKYYDDHYDATTFLLIWDERLPMSNEEIGMSWK